MIALSDVPADLHESTPESEEGMGYDSIALTRHFVHSQGYDCALQPAVKRRVTCASRKSFLNLIKNFVAFIKTVELREYPFETARSLRKGSVSVRAKPCLFKAIYLSRKEDHSFWDVSLSIRCNAFPNVLVKQSIHRRYFY